MSESLVSRAGRSRRATTGFAVLVTLALIALFADLITNDSPIVWRRAGRLELFPAPEPAPAGDVSFELRAPFARGPGVPTGRPFEPASSEHVLGTDAQGRDILSRLVHGTRTALGAGLVVALLGVVGGGLAGAVASQYTRRLGPTLERLAQAVDAFPAIIVVALLRAMEGGSTFSIVLGATLVQWASVARLVRSEVHRLGAEEFVLAARALGASPARIFVRHLLPHLGPTLVSSAALGLSAVVVLETTLSFLGLGPPIDQASWGEMLAEGARHPEHVTLLLLPAGLLAITVGSAYLVAEGLREAQDPVMLRARAPSPTREAG